MFKNCWFTQSWLYPHWKYFLVVLFSASYSSDCPSASLANLLCWFLLFTLASTLECSMAHFWVPLSSLSERYLVISFHPWPWRPLTSLWFKISFFNLLYLVLISLLEDLIGISCLRWSSENFWSPYHYQTYASISFSLS